eukprot:4778228-Amphidinium_carterae.1
MFAQKLLKHKTAPTVAKRVAQTAQQQKHATRLPWPVVLQRRQASRPSRTQFLSLQLYKAAVIRALLGNGIGVVEG